MEAIIEQVFNKKQKYKRVFLFLENLHKILKDPEIDKQYNTKFLASLNALSKNLKVSILSFTEGMKSDTYLYDEKGKAEDSILPLKDKEVDKPSKEMIELDLDRKFTDLENKKQIASFIWEQKKPYLFLEYTIEHFKPSELLDKNSIDILKEFQKKYDAETFTSKVIHVRKDLREKTMFWLPTNFFSEIFTTLGKIIGFAFGSMKSTITTIFTIILLSIILYFTSGENVARKFFQDKFPKIFETDKKNDTKEDKKETKDGK